MVQIPHSQGCKNNLELEVNMKQIQGAWENWLRYNRCRDWRELK